MNVKKISNFASEKYLAATLAMSGLLMSTLAHSSTAEDLLGDSWSNAKSFSSEGADDLGSNASTTLISWLFMGALVLGIFFFVFGIVQIVRKALAPENVRTGWGALFLALFGGLLLIIIETVTYGSAKGLYDGLFS